MNVPSLGFAWSARIVAFIDLPILIACNLILRSRLPPRDPGPMLDFKYFKDPAFSFFSIGFFFILLGWPALMNSHLTYRNVHSPMVHSNFCSSARHRESQSILAPRNNQWRLSSRPSASWILRGSHRIVQRPHTMCVHDECPFVHVVCHQDSCGDIYIRCVIWILPRRHDQFTGVLNCEYL